MEHFELVEKLVNTFGVSYEKAKEALEVSNWDAIDAAIYLEREKQGVKNEAPAAAEEPVREQEKAPEEPTVNTGTKGSARDATKSAMDDIKEEGGKVFKTVWDFLSQNTFVVKKGSGEVFLDIPIWLMALLLCAFFWVVVMILVIVFIMGYRFSFSGPQLGKKSRSAGTRGQVSEDKVQEPPVNASREPEEAPAQDDTGREEVIVEKVTVESIIDNAEPLSHPDENVE